MEKVAPIFMRTVTPRRKSVTLPVPPSFVGKSFLVSFFPVAQDESASPAVPVRPLSEQLWGAFTPEAAESFDKHTKKMRSEWQDMLADGECVKPDCCQAKKEYLTAAFRYFGAHNTFLSDALDFDDSGKRDVFDSNVREVEYLMKMHSAEFKMNKICGLE